MAMSGKSEEIVDRLVKTGRFASRADVIEASVKLLEAREQILDEIWKDVEEGLADAEAGRVYSVEEVRERLMKRFSVDT